MSFKHIDQFIDKKRCIFFTFFVLYFVIFLENVLSAGVERNYYEDGADMLASREKTALRETPDINGHIVGYLYKGQEIHRSRIIGSRRIPKGGVEPKKWIHIRPPNRLVKEAWLQRKDVYTIDEFDPVKEWPIKTFWRYSGDDIVNYRFTPDGTVSELKNLYVEESEKGKWSLVGLVLYKDGIVSFGGGEKYFYDKSKKLICDFPINSIHSNQSDIGYCQERITYFSKKEAIASPKENIVYPSPK